MIRCTDGSGGTTDSPTAGGPPRNLHRKQGGIPGTPLMPPHRSHVGGPECSQMHVSDVAFSVGNPVLT